MARIGKAEFGEIVVGGKSYFSDVTISARGVVVQVKKSHSIHSSDVDELLKDKPQCIVIGAGFQDTIALERGLRERLEKKKVMFFVDNTLNAAWIFNGLAADRKKVAGIFHTTS
jgi:hypothetical protein